jgi:hypothetical protein
MRVGVKVIPRIKAWMGLLAVKREYLGGYSLGCYSVLNQ